MKWLVGLLLVAVALEGVGVVWLICRQDQAPAAIGSSSQPRAATPPSNTSSSDEGRLEQKVAALGSAVEDLRARLESLQSTQNRKAESAPALDVEDLDDERFVQRVHQLSLEAVAQRDEQDRRLAFEQKSGQFAQSIADRWPLRYGSLDDLAAILARAYERQRAIFLKYTPDGIQLSESDPNRAPWIAESQAYDSWIQGEFQTLYGSPLPQGMESLARSVITGAAAPFK